MSERVARRRFFQKVRRVGECWEWTGARNRGYGVVRINNRVKQAHRVIWEWRYGPIPSGLVIDHLCRNHSCIKLSHLRVTTHRENILSGTGASARNAAKTHCKRGHEYTPENIYKRASGVRTCKQCSAEDYRRRSVSDEFREKNRARASAWYEANRERAKARARENYWRKKSA